MDTDQELACNELLSSNGIRYLKDIETNKNEKEIEEKLSVERLELPKIIQTQKSANFNKKTCDGITINLENFEDESIDFQDYLNNPRFLHDITYGLEQFEFEAGIETEEISRYSLIRLRSHASYVYACAHACYFIGHVNRFKRNLNEIKQNLRIKQLNTRTDFGLEKQPGLRVGIIGAGRLGRQLALSLLEFGDVQPNELVISTRQPDNILSDLKQRGVDCVFDNEKVALTCDVMFVCVLPSQIDDVLDDIKKHYRSNCLIYSFVRTLPAKRLKNYISPDSNEVYILKPNYDFNTECKTLFKWNYSLDIIESLSEMSMIQMTDPIEAYNDTIIKSDDFFFAGLVYAMINLCYFMDMTKSQCLSAFKAYLFLLNNNEKQLKIDETWFFDKDENDNFNTIDLIQAINEPTQFSNKLGKSKTLKNLMSKNYIQYFEDLIKSKRIAYK